MSSEDIEYTSVDLSEFYDESELSQDETSTDLIVLTEKERILVNIMFDRLAEISPERMNIIADRVADLERLTRNIAHFPSLLERQEPLFENRNRYTLLENLLSQHGNDKTLHVPTKALLGKGFLVAKFHLFMTMSSLSMKYDFPRHEIQEYKSTALTLMFTVMAEDVYISLLDNTDISVDLRQQIANALIILWEHRSDQNVADMAPVLGTVWRARRKIAPVFGTMVGTSELLLLSMEMDNAWIDFISQKAGVPEIAMALEEFLFGLSYEDIQRVKTILKDKGIHAIGRQEVASLLGITPENPDDDTADPRQLYLNYSIRRDNAKARLRMNLSGPHHTLEDHYMQFILETNKEKQYNDIFAR